MINVHLKSSEVKLVEALNFIHQPAGWHAIHFHLSHLLEQYKSDYQAKIAINLIHDVMKTYEGGIFLLVDGGIIVLCHGLDKPVLNKLIFQLRYLYMDDPLAYTEEGQENPDFCTVYELERSWQEFFELSTRRMAISVRRVAAPIKAPQPKAPALPDVTAKVDVPPLAPKLGMFSASRLATIEEDLRHADLSRVIRRQPVCAVLPNAPVRKVFDELYIHIAHLRQMLRSEVDFFSNRWLFKYMTQILDQRMIDLVRHNATRYIDSPISLNLNVETLLSSWFEEFDAAVKPAVRVSVVIEVPVVDVFSDITGFMIAKEQAQKLGYRICLDGLTSTSFANIDRDKLGVDLVKVQWNADATADLKTQENQDMVKAVQNTGSNRVILCRCDNKQAIDYGQAMGISLFQGRYIDGLINPTSKIEN